MAVITVSRELAALGDETAREFSKLLNYRFVDKAAVEARIRSFGITGAQMDKYDERRPGILANMSQERDAWLHFLKSALFTEAAQGNCIFTGRGASIVFRGLPALVSVFMTAPFDVRVERVKSYFHCDDRKARQILVQSDRDRAGFHANFFEVDWRAPSNYHLSLNTGHFSPQICARLIKDLLDIHVTKEDEARQIKRLAELSLGQRIVTHILYEKGINIHFLEAAVNDSKVELFGVANSNALVEAAAGAAGDIAGDLHIVPEIQVVQEYNVLN